MRSPLRVLDYHWHCAHGYRLMALPIWTIHYLDPRRIRGWRLDQRPMPGSFGGWVDRYEPGQYDLVFMHLDNWCDRWPLRAFPFRIMDQVVGDDVPRLCIMHGRPNPGTRNREQILQVLGDGKWLICNSHRAEQEWAYPRSATIWHGYDPAEWPRATFTGRPYAVTVCSGGDTSWQYHGLGIVERLRRDIPELVWLGDQGDFACRSYAEYQRVLAGARCYVHTAQWAPMSGARTEAMLCGVPVVTTGNDDEDMLFHDGVDAIVTNNYVRIAAAVRHFLDDPDEARRVGERGRAVAEAELSQAAYQGRWQEFLSRDLGLDVGGADG